MKVKMKRMRIITFVALGLAAIFLFLLNINIVGYVFLALGVAMSLYTRRYMKRVERGELD